MGKGRRKKQGKQQAASSKVQLNYNSSANSSSSSSPSLTSSRQHPLLIPVILSEVFEYMSVQDLHSCRRVAKTWESSSRPQWRSGARLVIDGNSVGGLRLSKRKGDDGEEDTINTRMAFTEFLHFLENPQLEHEHKLNCLPFSKICLFSGKALHVPFFELYGAHIKELTLKWCGEWGGTDFKRIILQLIPNLEVLTVEGNWPENWGAHRNFIASGIDGFPDHEHLKIFTVDLRKCLKKESSLDFGFWLRHFPNIHTLTVRGLDHVEHCSPTLYLAGGRRFLHLVRLLNGIVGVREESPNKLKITHLDILHALCVPPQNIEPLVPLFRRAALPLTTLKIALGSETEKSSVQELLQLYSSTLQSLHCFKSGGDSYAINDFLGDDTNLLITYPNLREITLDGNFRLSNLHFLRATPNLEILKCSKDYSSSRFESAVEPTDFELGEVRLEGMKELRANCLVNSPAWFRKLGEWMPNLEKLDVPLDKDTFPVVCQSWGQSLRELTIRYTSQVDDQVLTGIPRGWSTKQHNSRFLIKDRPANITDLRVLESFNDFIPYDSRFSNHSVSWGFAHLPRLERVFANVPQEMVNISSANQAKLRKKGVTLTFRQAMDDNL